MSEKFVLMNVLIKGTNASIKKALAKLDPKSYEMHTFSYDPEKENEEEADTSTVKVGLVFNNIYKEAVSKDEIPFAAMPDVKFIGMGNGVDGSGSDGTYVFYKDFGETGASECYRFTNVSPFREEFEGQYDVLDKVRHSFMDHTWQYDFLNYSYGEYDPYAFNGKKDKALVEKWMSDEKEDVEEETDNTTTDDGRLDADWYYERDCIEGIIAKLKRREDIPLFSDFWRKNLGNSRPRCYHDEDLDLENNFEEQQDGFVLEIEESPLLDTWEGGNQIRLFVLEFIKENPSTELDLEYKIYDQDDTSEAIWDSYHYTNGKLYVRRAFSEDGIGDYCEECDSLFEDYLIKKDLPDDEEYTCPLCGENIEYTAQIEEYELSLVNGKWIARKS